MRLRPACLKVTLSPLIKFALLYVLGKVLPAEFSFAIKFKNTVITCPNARNNSYRIISYYDKFIVLFVAFNK